MFTSSGNTGTRNIAAPFQPNQPSSSSRKHSSGNSIRGVQLPEVVQCLVDFRNHAFVPLTPLHQLRYEHYVGPTNESNWVIPGILLVGAYPASQDDIETFELITSILKLGIRKFVCLQQEYRPGVPESMWREGLALRPYFEDVQHIVANKALIPSLRDLRHIVDIEFLSFEHCPIVDCGITDDSKVLELARKLVYEISIGEVIYLHCWGGHGRTGTVVSIMLHLMYGLNPYEAMERCQVVHDLRRCRVEVGSPQTQTQRDQVIRIVNALMRGYRETAAPPTSTIAQSESMLTRVMSPATNTLKKLFQRLSPSNSAQNSTHNLHATTTEANSTISSHHHNNNDKDQEDDHGPPTKEHEVQQAMPTSKTPSKTTLESPNAPSTPSSNSNPAANIKTMRQKSLTIASPQDVNNITGADNNLLKTPSKPKLNIATDASNNSTATVLDSSGANINSLNTASTANNTSSTNNLLFSPMTPAKQSTPVLQTPTPKHPNALLRQSTEKMKNHLSNPSSPEPTHLLDETIANNSFNTNLFPADATKTVNLTSNPTPSNNNSNSTSSDKPALVKRSSYNTKTLLSMVEEGTHNNTSSANNSVHEVVNLQTGGSFLFNQSNSNQNLLSIHGMTGIAATAGMDEDHTIILAANSADSFDHTSNLPNMHLSSNANGGKNTNNNNNNNILGNALVLPRLSKQPSINNKNPLVGDNDDDGDALHAPPSFRASTAGAATVSSTLDGNDNSLLSPSSDPAAVGDGSGLGGRSLMRANSTTSVSSTTAAAATQAGMPAVFSRQASMSRQTSINNKKDANANYASNHNLANVNSNSNMLLGGDGGAPPPLSRLGSINGFMEPISASSVAPSIGPGGFSRQSSLKRSQLGTALNNLDVNSSSNNGSNPVVVVGRFSRQSSMKRDTLSEISKAIEEVEAKVIPNPVTANNSNNPSSIPTNNNNNINNNPTHSYQINTIASNSPSTENNTVVQSNPNSRRGSFNLTVASARNEVLAEEAIGGYSSTNNPIMNTASVLVSSPSATSVSSANQQPRGVATNSTPFTSPANSNNNNIGSDEKKKPVPPVLARSPNSGRNFGGVAQSVGRKIETVSSPTPNNT